MAISWCESRKKGTTCILNLLCLFKMSIKSIRQWGWHTVETYKGLTAQRLDILIFQPLSTNQVLDNKGTVCPWPSVGWESPTILTLRGTFISDRVYIDRSLPCNNPLKLCDDFAIVICSNWIVIHSVNSVSIIWWFVVCVVQQYAAAALLCLCLWCHTVLICPRMRSGSH